MVSVQKRRLSFFSHWLKMERSQNWPDLGSPISKFRDINFIIDTVNRINRWKFPDDRRSFSWCSYDEHSNFCWGEVTSRDLLTWPWMTLVWHFSTCVEKMYEQVYQKRAAVFFFEISANNHRGYCVSKHPGPARVRPPGVDSRRGSWHSTRDPFWAPVPEAVSCSLLPCPLARRVGHPRAAARWPRRAAAGVGVWGRPALLV